MRLVQFNTTDYGTQVGLVEGNHLRVLTEIASTYALAQKVFETGKSITELVEDLLGTKTVAYEPLLTGNHILLPWPIPTPTIPG